jgi:hypothetical protein
MGTGLGVDATVCHTQPLYGATDDEMFRDDFFRVRRLHMAVPDGIGIDDHRGPVLALVQASGFVDAHGGAQIGGFGELLQLGEQLALAIRGAGRPRSTLGTDVVTDKYVTFKRRQKGKSSSSHGIRLPPACFPQDGTGIAAAIDPARSETMKSEPWKPIIW